MGEHLPIPRATVAEIVSRRNQALAIYADARQTIEAANDKMREAGDMLRLAAPGENNHVFSREDRERFFGSLSVPDDSTFSALARHMVDADVWSHVLKVTDLEMLMDKKAKDELRQQLITDPPEFTEDNVCATLERFAAEAGTIFKRGIAEVFSKLDRRFRSHDGFKIGSRVIIDGAFDGFGHWSYYRAHRDTLQDIERTFLLLDGKKPKQQYAGLVGAIDDARGMGWSARQTELETEYFKVRIFKNGNCHLWFTRDDLLRRVNKLLAEYYGEAVGDGRTPEDDGGLNDAKRTPAKNYGFFPTPEGLAHRVIDEAKLHSRDGETFTVLEPSAGTGALASLAASKRAIVDCVEIQGDHAEALRASRRYRTVHRADFLELKPETLGLYDRIVMNPPFDRERDIDHVMHALKFLKPDGFLVSIMSQHTEFAESKKATAFRAHVAAMNGQFRDLPERSFACLGTNVNTILLRVFKDGRTFW